MRKLVLFMLALLMLPSWTTEAGKKHGQHLQELNHKMRMKKAAKQDPGAKKSLLKRHHG